MTGTAMAGGGDDDPWHWSLAGAGLWLLRFGTCLGEFGAGYHYAPVPPAPPPVVVAPVPSIVITPGGVGITP